METILKNEASKLNINLTDDMIKNFLIYKDVLKEWNNKINLTAITEDYDIIMKHFIDSLTIEKYIPKNARIIDVGTGAGFPGIPIKIVRSDIEVVLLDSLNKRINFLNEVIEVCNLQGIVAVHGRAEDMAQKPEYREKFDISTARAVANIATLSEYCCPFVKLGGSFICMKADADEEIENAAKAITTFGMKMQEIEKLKLEKIDANRTIIIYKKEKNTPKLYPRKAGIPSKNPII